MSDARKGVVCSTDDLDDAWTRAATLAQSEIVRVVVDGTVLCMVGPDTERGGEISPLADRLVTP